MLDTWYPNLRAFVRACRAAAKLAHLYGQSPAIYNPRKILQSRAMVRLNNGEIVHPWM